MQLNPLLKDRAFWLHILAGVGVAALGALQAVPNPLVQALFPFLSAVYHICETYAATRQVDMGAVMDAVAKGQAAAAVVVQPKFDANVFGGMTQAEKDAAAKK